MAKKKKLESKAPVPLTRGQVSRRAREQQRIRQLYTVGVAVASLVVLLLGWAVINNFVLRPNQQVAKVGDVVITRDDYNKVRRYNLYQQIQNAAMMQQLGGQGAQLSPGASNVADLQQRLRNVETEAVDPETITQMQDNEVLRQASTKDFSLSPSKEELRQYAYKDFAPSPTPLATDTPLPVTPSATVLVTSTATGTPPTATATRTSTAGPSSTATATSTPSATLPPVPGAMETAEAVYKRYTSALEGSVQPNPASAFCDYGCPDVNEDDFLRIAFEPRFRREQVTDKLSATNVMTEVTQIRVRHILTDTKEGADKLISELEKGADFVQLANEQSKDELDDIGAGRPPTGGLIEWFPQEGSNLVQPFVDCAYKIELDKYGAPCETQFGWHIIKVIEKDPKRPRDAAQIDSLKAKLYNDWFEKAKASLVLEPAPPAPTATPAPVIVEPTTPPVQPQPADGTPTVGGATQVPGDAVTPTTSQSPVALPTSTGGAQNATPTKGPNQ